MLHETYAYLLAMESRGPVGLQRFAARTRGLRGALLLYTYLHAIREPRPVVLTFLTNSALEGIESGSVGALRPYPVTRDRETMLQAIEARFGATVSGLPRLRYGVA